MDETTSQDSVVDSPLNYLTVRGAADKLSVSEATVRKLLKEKKIPYHLIAGKTIRISEHDLHKFMQSIIKVG